MLGGAIGDALGMPFERVALSDIRQNFTFPIRGYFDPVEGAPCYQFNLTKGMYTDDTQAVRASARALIDAGYFSPRVIATGLRGWLFECSLAQDPRYPGITTDRALRRFVETDDPTSSGYLSSSCGAAIRISPVALWLTIQENARFRANITKCAKITHTGQAAIDGALVVALCIKNGLNGRKCELPKLIRECKSNRMIKALNKVLAALKDNRDPNELIADLGGQTGADEVVAMALYHVHRNDFRFTATMEGGLDVFHPSGTDMDSILSIAGAISGVSDPSAVAESKWLSGLEGVKMIREEADQLLQASLARA